MAKDPAFLFYHHDFLVGTAFMSAEEVGVYIRLLCHLADKGKLTQKEFDYVCNTYVPTYELRSKFKIDDDGCYYNERLLLEVNKRKAFCESRRKSINERYVRSTHEVRMVNRDIDENVVNKPTKTSKKTTKTSNINKDFEVLWEIYPNKLGKSAALRHFNASVITPEDYQDISTALDNYIEYCKNKEPQFIKHGSTWFNNWKDWVNYKEPKIVMVSKEPAIVKETNEFLKQMEQWEKESKNI